MNKKRWRIRATGIVQGVGFRPFIFRLAQSSGITGIVYNDQQGVVIEGEGNTDRLDHFFHCIQQELPPHAILEKLAYQEIPLQHDTEFQIIESERGKTGNTLVSPDLATCGECLEEIFDPQNRRFRYPFTNCTHCGPRFSIIKDVPYDRAVTTMADFTMCPECRQEYRTPSDRRFHAEPNACGECGPGLRVLQADGKQVETKDPIQMIGQALKSGEIVAIQGIGGVHLACLAQNEQSVKQLRIRKHRPDKPLAVMVKNLEWACRLCEVSEEEAQLLQSPSAPIVLMKKRSENPVAEEVAPRQQRLGIMLPYTPLHHLLLHEVDASLVMTSGNLSGLPMVHEPGEALRQLHEVADRFLMHNRTIYMRCDDSVARVVHGKPTLLRRARGYTPLPILAPKSIPTLTSIQSGTMPMQSEANEAVLGCGAELKSTFCLGKGSRLYLSHYIGDLGSYETFAEYEKTVEHFFKLFRFSPTQVAYDLHPDYQSTRFAKRYMEHFQVPGIGIQHHEAHVASCLVDNECSVDESVIGIAFDGTGYGRDGALWGGEFFTGNIRRGFRRKAHFSYMPLPGGELAVQQPWRSALAHLLNIYGTAALSLPLPFISRIGKQKMMALQQMIAKNLNCPMTSSVGRIFDSVAAILDVTGTDRVSYEGQAAIELEQMVDEEKSYPAYDWKIDDSQDTWVIQPDPMIRQIVEDRLAGVPVTVIATRFHQTIIQLVVDICEKIRVDQGITTVAMSGGVFQNHFLLESLIDSLQKKDFGVYWHQRVPGNDGGISVGQAVLAQYCSRYQ